jgi:phosphatidylglycerophosphate synthase
MHLRGRFALVSVAACAAVAASALVGRRPLGFSDAYPWLATTVVAGILAIAVAGVGRHHPFPRLGPANRVTVLRALVLSFVAALVRELTSTAAAWTAVVLATVVAVLDGVDGKLARSSGMSSAFGARFDMELDAFLILVLSVLVWRHDKAGAWVLAGGLLRYVWVGASAVLEWMRRPLSPTLRGKTVAVTHMVGLTTALGPIIPWPLSAVGAALTLALLVWSFAIDLGRLQRLS